MFTDINIAEDLYYVGSSDRRLERFENAYPVPDGMSYNSYLICDTDATVLMDAVDKSVSKAFLESLKRVLGTRSLDYIVIQHMEPDHSATAKQVLELYPNACVVASQRALDMLVAFNDIKLANVRAIKEGDVLKTARHELCFIAAPMVHWPEVMVTYDKCTGTLFSADAFGTFGASSGNLFADESDFDMDEARRYYFNIVGKYGVQVQSLLKKASGLDIRMLCPLHGPIWRENIASYVEKYSIWSSYQSEKDSVLIVYGSIYGNTEQAALALAALLAKRNVKGIEIYDSSKTDLSVLLSKCFSFKAIAFASSSYNAGLFTSMETLLLDLKAHNLQNKTIALIENGSWAPSSGRCMKEILDSMKSMTYVCPMLSIRSSLKECQMEELEAMADSLAQSVLP
ncbi:MAG: FprA family A-type flavoprotein [Sphaerochaetaceae bacterium]|jgi:flavorubredoxin|nr:FprA family A-type flavoprotein [Sphaerochaetaceae bacterium]